MRRTRILRGLLAAAVATTALTAQPATAGGLVPGYEMTVPRPADDPFYRVPAQIPDVSDGTVLDYREITPTSWSVPLPARAWQVRFKSLDAHDRPTVNITTVLVPDRPWIGSGPQPLLSYQTAEDGVALKCTVSYALRAGWRAGGTNANGETAIISNALNQGWIVAAHDYEGPRSEFLAAPGEAYGVLNGIRAALNFAPDGARLVEPDAPIGMWGYSGGAYASSLAAQRQPSYAPELNIAGIALGGVVADLRATLDGFDGSPAGGAIMVGLVGLDRGYPEAGIPELLNDVGRQRLRESQGDCINDAVNRYPFMSSDEVTDNEAVLDEPGVKQLIAENSPLTFPGVPSAPVYSYQAILDEVAPWDVARALTQRFCDAGVPVQEWDDPASDHSTLVASGAPGAIAYLSDRFAGIEPPSTC